MKKFMSLSLVVALSLSLLLFPATSFAWSRGGHGGWHGRGGYRCCGDEVFWGILGGAAVIGLGAAILSQPPPPVVYYPAPVPVYPVYPAPSRLVPYCDNPVGYYPQLQNCPGGWRAVPIQ